MGDHTIGKAMGVAADAWWRRETVPTKEEALAALDVICSPYRGRDAEFEAEDPARPGHIHPAYDNYTDPLGPIGMLIMIAFDATEAEASLGNEDVCPWHDGVGTFNAGPYARFCRRYEFY